jgi:hypothetical protein
VQVEKKYYPLKPPRRIFKQLSSMIIIAKTGDEYNEEF